MSCLDEASTASAFHEHQPLATIRHQQVAQQRLPAATAARQSALVVELELGFQQDPQAFQLSALMSDDEFMPEINATRHIGVKRLERRQRLLS